MSYNMSKISWSAQCELASVQESNGKYKGFRPFCTTLELLAIRDVSACTTIHNAFDTVLAAHGTDCQLFLFQLVHPVYLKISHRVISPIRSGVRD